MPLLFQSAPFVYINGTGDNANYNGMCMEMLQELSLLLNFTYSLKRVPDGQFGAKTKHGNWTGLVGMIERGVSNGKCCVLDRFQLRVGMGLSA